MNLTGQWSSRGTALAWAAAGGVVLLATDDARWLSLTGFVGLLCFCEALEQARTESLAFVAACAGVFGTLANAVALGSLIDVFHSAGLAWPLAFTLSLLVWVTQSACFVVGAVIDAMTRPARRQHAWLTLPASIVVASSFTPMVLPWPVAATQVGFLSFAQVAELGGAAAVGLMIMIAVTSLHAIARAKGRQRITLAIIGLSAIALPVSYGSARIPEVEREREKAPVLRIGIAQSNVTLAEKHDEASALEQLRKLRALTKSLEDAGAALTVWGETAYPYRLLRSEKRAPNDVRRVLDDGVRGPVLLGLETYASLDDDPDRYNSAWLVERDGTLSDRIDKAQLIPFSEYVPLWAHLPAIRTRFARRGFVAGRPGVVRAHGSALGVLICYEDLFASSARETVKRGARALVNLTNDAWFGTSREPVLHELLSRLRSIELRRDLVRAVNTGVSSFTSASGRSITRTATFEPAHFVAEVRLLDPKTPFARFGDWLSYLLALALCVRLMWPRTRSE